MAPTDTVKITIRTLGPHALWLPSVQTRVEPEPHEVTVPKWKVRGFEADGRVVVMDAKAKKEWKAAHAAVKAKADNLKAEQKVIADAEKVKADKIADKAKAKKTAAEAAAKAAEKAAEKAAIEAQAKAKTDAKKKAKG